jgi:hypothetical protein
MTILIAGVWTGCALLAVDTLGTDTQIEPGRLLKMSKLNVIPHARFAFAVRGVQTYASVLHWLLNNPRPVEDFDDLLQNLEMLLSSLHTNVVTAAKQQGVNLVYVQCGQPAVGVELVLIG